jgi:hypothetical protein
MRRAWDGLPTSAPDTGSQLRTVLLNGTRWAVERFLAGIPSTVDPASRARARVGQTDDFVACLAQAAAHDATLPSRLACLATVSAAGRRGALVFGLDQLEREGHHSPGMHFLQAEAACLAGHWDAAFSRGLQDLDLTKDDEVTAFRLRQLARIARSCGQPERALPWLARWLDRFPDSPDSGAVWLDRCLNASQAGGHHLTEAGVALDRASDLLGASAVVDKVRRLTAAQAAVLALQPAVGH